ncbi:hypothetical protein L6164_022366 [Bauhinia variegata]|uniref:Uncharacterized protein n=1 Tax=Bauhinia variegata TaxID=167791 RepID=A0ACB9MHU3_BAUVA|nr:hypothetical protein L6164_022366 [Bauhinia variegata]
MIKSGRLSEPSREFRIVLPEPLRMKASFLFGEEILLIFRCFATQAVLFGFKEYLLQEAFQLQEEQRWLLEVVCWKFGGGERQFNGLTDVYRKTIKSDGIAGLYRGFNISCVGHIVNVGLSFGKIVSLLVPFWRMVSLGALSA